MYEAPPPCRYQHLDEGTSWVGKGLESLNDTRGYAGGNLASGRVTLDRQALVERPDQERYPGPRGWGLAAGLTTLSWKKINSCEELSDGSRTALMEKS